LQIPVKSCNKDFLREAEIMKGLKHPNIVGYFGDRLIDNYFIILIEWMPGLQFILVVISAFVNFLSLQCDKKILMHT